MSECPDGIGPRNFFDLLSSAPTPEGVMAKISQGYKLGYHKAAKLVEMFANGGKVRMVSSVDPETLKKAFIVGHPTLAEAIGAAQKDYADATVILMPEGNLTVPTTPDMGACL